MNKITYKKKTLNKTPSMLTISESNLRGALQKSFILQNISHAPFIFTSTWNQILNSTVEFITIYSKRK